MASKHNSEQKYIADILFDAFKNDAKFCKETADVLTLFEADAAIAQYVRHPLLTRKQYQDLWQTILQEVGVQSSLKDVLLLLCNLGRSLLIIDVLKRFQSRIGEQGGQVIATVETARPLQDDIKAKILNFVQKHMVPQTTKNVILTELINPSLMDGIRVAAGTKWIDLSVRTALHRLEQRIKE